MGTAYVATAESQKCLLNHTRDSSKDLFLDLEKRDGSNLHKPFQMPFLQVSPQLGHQTHTTACCADQYYMLLLAHLAAQNRNCRTRNQTHEAKSPPLSHPLCLRLFRIHQLARWFCHRFACTHCLAKLLSEREEVRETDLTILIQIQLRIETCIARLAQLVRLANILRASPPAAGPLVN